MNICYINPTNNIRRPIAELANILTEQGHQISIVYPKSKDCPTKNWVANDAVKNNNIKLIPIKSFYFAPLRYNFPNIVQLWKACKKIYRNNDKVHVWEYFYPLSVIPLIYAAFNKKRKEQTILTTDGFVGYSYKPKQPWWLVPAFKIYTQLFARFFFKIPKQMTTYGKAMLPYAKQAGVPLKKLRVIPTGIHLNKFQNVDQDKVKTLKKEFNIKENEKIILYVGMLTERKRIDKVVKISNKLLDEKYNIKTLIVGDAHGDNPYPKLVKPEYKDKIIFTGGRKNIPEFMKIADLLLLPSEGEGLPGVVMEAMASGLPVVATNEGCTPDLIENEKEGFLVDNNYFNSIIKILKNNDLQEKIVKNSLKKIETFNWTNVSTRYKQVYDINK